MSAPGAPAPNGEPGDLGISGSSSLKRAQSPSAASSHSGSGSGSSAVGHKRVRLATPPPPEPKSVHAWLHPSAPPQLRAHSPALHDNTSTFLSFSIDYTPPSHITSESSLAKDVRRIVRELDVPRLVGEVVMAGDEGAFGDGQGRVGQGKGKGKERAREPDHRMWAVRAVVLKEGCDGTKGEDDYQLIEAFNDDGEKFGGDRVLRVMKENQGMDVITVCCRWYGGDMLGPIRFQHIGITARTSLLSLQTLIILRDLRLRLDELDAEIVEMRETLNPRASPLRTIDANSGDNAELVQKISPYAEVTDVARLKRLVVAREKTRASLESKVAWIGMEQSKAEEAMTAGRNGDEGA